MLDGHKIIALCTARIHDEDSYKFIERFNYLLAEKGHRLFIYSTNSDLISDAATSDVAQESVYELIPFDIVDVMVVMEEKINDKRVVEKIIRRAKEVGMPVIIVGKEYEGCGDIHFDYVQGFENVVRHVMVEHGIMDLHLIAGMKDNRFSDERIEVFRKVLEERGGVFRPDMVSHGYFWSEPTREVVETLIREDRVPRGIICCNDIMAITACNTLKKHGYRVPEDVVVTGFDGIDDIGYSDPPITSCKCRYEDIAKCLAECVDLEHEEMQKIRRGVSPYLIRAKSCGCGAEVRADACERLSEVNNRFYLYQEDEYTLTEVAAKIQMSGSVQEACDCMKGHYQLYDITCLLRKEMMEENRNPMERLEGDPFGERLLVFFDSDRQNGFEPYEMSRRDIVPGLDEILRRPYPMVFTALNFLKIPMGYVCFHFRSMERNYFVKIPQIINLLNNALGSLRNMRYQQYLNRWIEDLYKRDALTGLFNRNSFYQAFRRMQEGYQARGEQPKLTIIFADVDGLKQINDRQGHSEGDVAIRTTAQALRFACPENALCVRFGGDELIAVTDEECSEEEIREKFQRYVRERNEELKKPYQISASMGVFMSQDTSELDFEVLLKQADDLMYREKRAKKEKAEV